ncbi:hypothetical protein XENORESO_002341, partial [Xenotaenia resolanae]
GIRQVSLHLLWQALRRQQIHLQRSALMSTGCSQREETGADSRRRQEEGSHNKFPPTQHKMSSFPWLRRAPSHPAEKSRHLKLCDMCHRHCH